MILLSLIATLLYSKLSIAAVRIELRPPYTHASVAQAIRAQVPMAQRFYIEDKRLLLLGDIEFNLGKMNSSRDLIGLVRLYELLGAEDTTDLRVELAADAKITVLSEDQFFAEYKRPYGAVDGQYYDAYVKFKHGKAPSFNTDSFYRDLLDLPSPRAASTARLKDLADRVLVNRPVHTAFGPIQFVDFDATITGEGERSIAEHVLGHPSYPVPAPSMDLVTTPPVGFTRVELGQTEVHAEIVRLIQVQTPSAQRFLIDDTRLQIRGDVELNLASLDSAVGVRTLFALYDVLAGEGRTDVRVEFAPDVRLRVLSDGALVKELVAPLKLNALSAMFVVATHVDRAARGKRGFAPIFTSNHPRLISSDEPRPASPSAEGRRRSMERISYPENRTRSILEPYLMGSTSTGKSASVRDFLRAVGDLGGPSSFDAPSACEPRLTDDRQRPDGPARDDSTN